MQMSMLQLAYDDEKVQFFSSIFDSVLHYTGDSVIIGGDLNLTFTAEERVGGTAGAAETRVARMVKDRIRDCGLLDTWEGRQGHTWRRGRLLSRFDRVIVRLPDYRVRRVTTSWTLTRSDHAAVTVELEHSRKMRKHNEHVKLCNEVVKNTKTLLELREYVQAQMETAVNMDPHMKLEFLKMTIRTKALEIMARCRKMQNERLKELELEICTNTKLLADHADADSQVILLTLLNKDKIEVDEILQEQGKQLAHKAKTRWFNEGERSNKYFLNLLKRNGERNEMSQLATPDRLLEEADDIRAEVKAYYTQLYNNGAETCIDDTFLNAMFTIEEEFQHNIDAPITLEELWLALKPVRPTTPGPDGISNAYLKKLWDIMGPVILAAWNFSIESDQLAPSHRTSLLRLIPKAGKDVLQLKN